MKKIHLLIGGAGFIGNSLIKSLLEEGFIVRCVDDDTSENFDFTVKRFSEFKNVKFLKGDINAEESLNWVISETKDCEVTIWHLAANSDIQSGSLSPNLDAQKTFMTSVSVCNLMDLVNVTNVNFASTSAVYGELIDEESFFENSMTKPISFYGVAKLSSERFLEIKANSKQIPLLIFRFANIVGAPATHGVLFDFITRLKESPQILKVLGDGNQTKSYLHVDSLVKMMLSLSTESHFGTFNLGPGDSGISVREIAENLVSHVAFPIEIEFGTTKRGWEGDAVRVLMSTNKYEQTISKAPLSSAESIHAAIHEISGQLNLAIACPESVLQSG